MIPRNKYESQDSCMNQAQLKKICYDLFTNMMTVAQLLYNFHKLCLKKVQYNFQNYVSKKYNMCDF